MKKYGVDEEVVKAVEEMGHFYCDLCTKNKGWAIFHPPGKHLKGVKVEDDGCETGGPGATQDDPQRGHPGS